MEQYEEIQRVKKKFSLSNNEFFEGAWLNDIKKIFNYDKFDLTYQGNVLIVKFYKKLQIKDDGRS